MYQAILIHKPFRFVALHVNRTTFVGCADLLRMQVDYRQLEHDLYQIQVLVQQRLVINVVQDVSILRKLVIEKQQSLDQELHKNQRLAFAVQQAKTKWSSQIEVIEDDKKKLLVEVCVHTPSTNPWRVHSLAAVHVLCSASTFVPNSSFLVSFLHSDGTSVTSSTLFVGWTLRGLSSGVEQVSELDIESGADHFFSFFPSPPFLHLLSC